MNLTVGIIGAGAMGSGIAQVMATAGNKVIISDTAQASLDKAKSSLAATLEKLLAKEKISSEQRNEIADRHHYTTDLREFSSCDLVIEAIIEQKSIKAQVFGQLQQIVSPTCIIATNTSSLSVTELAASIDDPSRFIGIHFFNPAPLMALVEIIPALQTSQDVVERAFNWISEAGKKTVLAKDTPGFIVNRVARTFYSESIRIYEEGIADLATIDWAMTSIGGFRMGPFTLMDFIGHDVNFIVTETVYRGLYEEPRYKPSLSQKKLLEARFLGKKTGRGFYDYNLPLPQPQKDEAHGKRIVERVLAMLMNDAADALYFNVASRDDIDTAMTKGVNYPKGLLAWADEFGIARLRDLLDDLYTHYHEERYRCSPLIRKMATGGSRFYP